MSLYEISRIITTIPPADFRAHLHRDLTVLTWTTQRKTTQRGTIQRVTTLSESPRDCRVSICVFCATMTDAAFSIDEQNRKRKNWSVKLRRKRFQSSTPGAKTCPIEAQLQLHGPAAIVDTSTRASESFNHVLYRAASGASWPFMILPNGKLPIKYQPLEPHL